MVGEILSFDRAAGYYDSTRGLPADVADAVTGVLRTEVDARGTCLEVGVGTGRIAGPLADAGVTVVGVDAAEAMLRQLTQRSGPGHVPVALADALHLPVRDGSVGAVLFCHVLHLVSDWGAAVDEAVRVLRPDGVMLVDFGGGVPAPWNDDVLRILAGHGVHRKRPGLTDPQPLTAHLPAEWSVRPLPPVSMRVRRTLRRDIDDWRGQRFSWTWGYSPEQMAAACTAVQQWADDTGLDVDREVEVTSVIQWWRFAPALR